ncbi:MAG: hypothetical protein R2784_03880 [Saprospiraceae bacterium]
MKNLNLWMLGLGLFLLTCIPSKAETSPLKPDQFPGPDTIKNLIFNWNPNFPVKKGDFISVGISATNPYDLTSIKWTFSSNLEEVEGNAYQKTFRLLDYGAGEICVSAEDKETGYYSEKCKSLFFIDRPTPCGSTASAKENCFVCNNDPQIFKTNGTIPENAEDCIDFETASWILLPATTKFFKIELLSTRDSNGVRFKVFDHQFNTLSPCKSIPDVNTSTSVVNILQSSGLKYLLYEGIDGDSCTFSLTNLDVELPQLNNNFTASNLDGYSQDLEQIGIGDIFTVQADTVAYQYNWQIPSNFEVLGDLNQTKVKLKCIEPGRSEICLSLDGICETLPPVCMNTNAVFKPNSNLDNPEIFPGKTICDSYTGSTEGFSTENYPTNICLEEENSLWFNFRASQSNAKIRLSVPQCNAGSGLEFVLLNAQLEIIDNCEVVNVGQSSIIEFSNLLPEEDYFILVDGVDEAICDFSLELLEGGPNQVLPDPVLSITKNSQGFTSVSTSSIPRDVEKKWEVDTGLINSGQGTDSITVFSFELTEVCLTISTGCGSSNKVCKIIPVQFFPKEPCGRSSDMLPTCEMCGPIYIGSTAGFSPDTFPYDFPCGNIENSQWWSVTTIGTTMSFTVVPENCSNNKGLEIALYDIDLNLVTTCEASADPLNL